MNRAGNLTLLLTAFLGALVIAAEDEAPMLSAPSVDRPLTELITELGARDSDKRDRARESLMLLAREDLPRLADMVRDSAPLSSMQTALLREIVQHVYLTGFHNFAGEGSGFLGISAASNLTEEAVIATRTIGYDAYRVLRDGDSVVGMSEQRGPGRAMVPISNFEMLRSFVARQRPGEWIVIRVIRNGQPVEVTLRLAARGQQAAQVVGGVATSENPFQPQAQEYWETVFEPALAGPTSRPAS